MKSNFKCFFESFMVSEESEAEKIKAAIADVRKTYGEVYGDEIERLLNVVNVYGKKLKALKDSKVIRKPVEPVEPKRGQYGSQKAYERAVAAYPTKLSVYRKKMKSYWEELGKLNQEKLNEISKSLLSDTDYDKIPDSGCQLEYVLGNSKVGDDTIIINMGPATSCDAAKAGECELYNMGFCYAQNNETQHKMAIIKRFREQLQWKSGNPTTFAAQIAKTIQDKRKGKSSKPIKYVRFNESGDMNTQDDKKKLGDLVEETNKILAALGEEPVVFYTYTHRSDLFPSRTNDITDSPNLVIQGSGFFKNSGKGTKTPFYVDNCFMGIDYPNLIDLIRNGNFDQVTHPEGISPEGAAEAEQKGSLGLDFEGKEPRIVICRGACFNCNYCKVKGKRLLILIAYHGSGTKIKSASGQMTGKLGKMSEELSELLDMHNLPPEIKRELYDLGHFNEYLIVDRLIGYASSKDAKGKKKQPIMAWDSIAPLIKDIRALAKADEEESRKLAAAAGKKFMPITYRAGTRFTSDDDLNNYIAKAKAADEAWLQKKDSGEEEAPTDDMGVDLNSTQFDTMFKNFMVAEANKKDEMEALSKMSIQEIQNLAVSNKLVGHKDFVSPSTVQNLLSENEIDMDVSGDIPEGDGEQVEENWKSLAAAGLMGLGLATSPTSAYAKPQKTPSAVSSKTVAAKPVSSVDINKLLDALSEVESNGNTKAIGDNGRAKGILQIWDSVIKDVNRVYKTNYVHDDAFDPVKSRDIAKKYLAFWGKQYEKKNKKAPSYEVLARIWNGGPRGYRIASTVNYWQKVKKELLG